MGILVLSAFLLSLLVIRTFPLREDFRVENEAWNGLSEFARFAEASPLRSPSALPEGGALPSGSTHYTQTRAEIWKVLMKTSRRPKVGDELVLCSGKAKATMLYDGEQGEAVLKIESDRPLMKILDEEGVPQFRSMAPVDLIDLLPYGIACFDIEVGDNLKHPKLFIEPKTGNPHVFATDLANCIFEILELKPEVVEKPDAVALPPLDGTEARNQGEKGLPPSGHPPFARGDNRGDSPLCVLHHQEETGQRCEVHPGQVSRISIRGGGRTGEDIEVERGGANPGDGPDNILPIPRLARQRGEESGGGR